jgi:hypothetical protein
MEFSTAQAAIAHLHGSSDNIGASLVIFNESGKPIMQIQISHISLASVEPMPGLSLDYDSEQKTFTCHREGEDGSQSFPSMKAAIAHLSRHLATEARLTVRDSAGKPMFFATLGPQAGTVAA